MSLTPSTSRVCAVAIVASCRLAIDKVGLAHVRRFRIAACVAVLMAVPWVAFPIPAHAVSDVQVRVVDGALLIRADQGNNQFFVRSGTDPGSFRDLILRRWQRYQRLHRAGLSHGDRR